MFSIRKINIAISSILIVLLSGCQSGVKQSLPGKKPAYAEIKMDPSSIKETKKELSNLQKVKDDEYIISAGDQFDIFVYDNPELLTKGVIVMPDGTVSMELAGVVEIGDSTIEGATKAIEDKLGIYIINPKVTLVANHIKSATFTIIGSVVNPGVYPIRSGYRLTDAVAEASGLSEGEKDGDTIELANLDHAFVVRDKKMLPVDFVKVIKNGNRLNNIPLKNNDYIYIPSSMNLNVFIMGEVLVPGSCAYNENLTLLKALSWAQGRKKTSSDIAVVVRGNLVSPKVFKIDVEDILRGRVADFKLEPNDIVYFPSGYVADYNLIVKKIIPTFEVINLLAGPFGNR
ncbi:MAG: capsule biosynthesis protein CapA [bacterium]|nr:capsule biosynthesis protein CapA [bacterium]